MGRLDEAVGGVTAAAQGHRRMEAVGPPGEARELGAGGGRIGGLVEHDAVAFEHLIGTARYAEAVAVTRTILRHNPCDGTAWANQGNAFFKMCRAEFLDRYGSQFLIPLPLRARYLTLLSRNHAAFAAARALGWEPID